MFFSYFHDMSAPDFARSGNVASQTVSLDEGPLPQFTHSIEPQLRKLGLPVTLTKGTVVVKTSSTRGTLVKTKTNS